jgi:AcrR family transcriptional regulator
VPARPNSNPRSALLAAIVQVCSEQGYEATTVTQIIGRAGVSRATFYEHFRDKEACLVAALPGIQAHVRAMVLRSVEERPAQKALAACVTALTSFAQEHPAEARLLMSETTAAGTRALDVRDQGVDELARLVEGYHEGLQAITPTPVLPAETVIGATYRVLATRLRHRQRLTASLPAELIDWLADYESPDARQRWQTLVPARALARSPFLASSPLRAPPPVAPGRPRTSAGAVAENHRLRILFATAEIVRRDGYAAASVAAITRAAGVDSRAFYRQFADKRDAFAAVHELAFQSTMAVTAGAFFTADAWSPRIWEAARTFTQHLEQNAALTHASLIAGQAGGAETVQRFEHLLAGFTIFLQEGYQHQPGSEGKARAELALEAIAQANFEMLYRQARSARPDIASLAGQLTYICLAPFVGSGQAGESIDELLARAEEPSDARGDHAPPQHPEMERGR